jgi:hypothetical protein
LNPLLALPADEFPVARDHGPTISFGSNGRSSLVKHGFDREHHAFLQRQARIRLSPVQNLGRLVHFSPDAMSAVFAYDRIAVSAGMQFDGVPYVAKSGAGAHGLDPLPHRFIGHL